MKLPFEEIIKNKERRIRKFSPSIDENELKWHFDLEDRVVVPLSENDWKIQIDNNLPQAINKPIFIKAKEWHRILKGKTELELEIFFT